MNRTGIAAVIASLVAGMLLGGCTPPENSGDAPPPSTGAKATPATSTAPTKGVAKLQVSSTAFGDGEGIAVKYTGNGADESPPLKWSKPPAGTQEIAITCEDPDAPGGTFTHWIIWGIAPKTLSIPEGLPGTETIPTLLGAKQGKNDFDRIGWNGPKPPPGTEHHYVFVVYALDAPLKLDAGADKAQFAAALKGHVLAQGTLTGVYAFGLI